MKDWKIQVTTGFFLLLLLVPAVGQADMLKFLANGEELATEGFVAPELTGDGWTLTFRHIYVGLAEVTAYQTAPPYDAVKGGEIAAAVKTQLPGRYLVDLVEGADEGSRVLVDEMKAPAGHYNAISWKVVRSESGASSGSSMIFVGTAEKDGKTVDFELVSNEEATYRCGEYVGDDRKGFLSQGGSADLEMTFHLDHIFGRADKPADDPMNLEALGFAPFAGGGKHSVSLRGLHIGHVGEGHCAVEWH